MVESSSCDTDACNLQFANDIIERYQTFKRSSPFAIHCEDFTLMSCIGNSLEGQDVLDLGCGWGCYTHCLAERRPASLVASDLSHDAVCLAKVFNKDFPFVEYRVEDCAEIRDQNRFDLILANFVLPFNSSVERLRRTCANLYAALKPGGRAVGMIPHGHQDVDFSRERVGRQVNGNYDTPAELYDGAEIHLVLYTQPSETRIPLRWFHQDTYRQALLDAGFQLERLRFDPPQVSEAGLAGFEPGFWDPIVNQPTVLLFTAVK